MENDSISERRSGLVDLDMAAALEGAIHTIWTLLPDQLQVSVIVSLIDSIQESENGLAQKEIRAALNEEGSLTTASYPVVEITRAKLQQVGLSGKQAEGLTDRQMLAIAAKMRSYISREDFWTDLETAAETVRGNAERKID